MALPVLMGTTLAAPELLLLGLPDALPLALPGPEPLLLTEVLWLWLTEAVKEGLREAEREREPDGVRDTEVVKLPELQAEAEEPLLPVPQLLLLWLPEAHGLPEAQLDTQLL